MKPSPRAFAASLLLLAIAAPATTQSQVIPASLTNLHGFGNSASPFGTTGPVRLQCIYEASEVGVSAPITINSIRLRADEGRLMVAKSGILLQVEMSTTAFTHTAFTSTFAINRGGDHRIVYNRKAFATATLQAATPGSLMNVITLDNPYTYNPAMGNLLIEFDVANQPNAAYEADWTSGGYFGYHSNVGTACNGLSSTSSGGGLGGNIFFNVSGGTPSGLGFYLLGSALLGAPLPVPGNPGCFLYQNLPIVTVVTLNGSGAGGQSFVTPADKGLRLVNVYGQFAIFNASLSNVNMTQSRSVILGDRYSCSSLIATSTTATTGSILRFEAPVISLN